MLYFIVKKLKLKIIFFFNNNLDMYFVKNLSLNIIVLFFSFNIAILFIFLYFLRELCFTFAYTMVVERSSGAKFFTASFGTGIRE